MRKMRFLTVLAAILLSCGIANAQTVKGDVNNDGKLNTLDVTAAADSIMDDKKSGLADVNEDQKVNAADVVSVVKLIQDTDYFMLGTEVPTKDNYTTVDGVVTTYESISKALEAAPTIEVAADKAGVLLCPSSWEAKDLVLQNEEDGTFYELAAAENDISDYDLFQTEMIAVATILKLKSKADAEAYKKIKETDFFYLGTQMPTKDNYTTIDGVVSTYKTIDEVLSGNSQSISLKTNQTGVLLCPSSWEVKDLVLQNETDGAICAFIAVDTDITGYDVFQTDKVTAEATYKLKTKAAADAYKESITPKDPEYFGLTVSKPMKSNYTTGPAGMPSFVTTDYKSLDDVIKAEPSLTIRDNDYGVIYYPESWGTKELVVQDKQGGFIYTLNKIASLDVPGYVAFQTKNKIQVGGEIYVRTMDAAKAKFPDAVVDPEPIHIPDPIDPVDPVVDPIIPPTNNASYATSDGPANGFRITITNNSGQTVKFSGKCKLYVKQGNNNAWSADASAEKELPAHINDPDDTSDGWPHWYKNNYTLVQGQSWTYDVTVLKDYVTATPTILSVDYYANGTWSFMTVDKMAGSLLLIPAVKLGQCVYDTEKKKLTNTSSLLHLSPMNRNDAKVQKGKHYHFIIDKYTPKAKYILQ